MLPCRSSIVLRALAAACALASVSAAPGLAAVWRVDQNAPTALENGLSWKAAYKTIGAALAAAKPGDEIWVAPGVYRQHLNVPAGVSLYGGFIGIETRRDQRRGMPDLSVLESDTDAACVSFGAETEPDTVLDGFTVRGSARSGGIVCADGSPTISHNIIRENGDGVYRQNRPGSGAAGIYRSGPRAVIVSNLLMANIGNAISGEGRIRNNTIVANTGTGAVVYGAGSEVSGNILAGNFGGLDSPVAGLAVRENCVWGNTLADYIGMEDRTGKDGNISADPRFAAPMAGNFHLQPGSPCVDAAASAAAGGLDLDLQPRRLGAAADMGAYESDGRTWRPAPYVIRVAPGGNDANDGGAWDRAKGTVAGALAAAGDGTEIWVRKGSYVTATGFQLPAFVSLYGGFAGTETTREARNPAASETILSRATSGHVLTARSGHRVSVVDGFTFTPATSFKGIGGIACEGASPIIRNNVLRGLEGGYALYLLQGSNAAPLITDNTLRDNPMSGTGEAMLFFYGGSAPDLQRNAFLHNGAPTGSPFAAGVIGIKASPRIVLRDNVFARNRPSDTYGWIHGVLVDEVEVVNNTFVANTGPFGSIGLPRSLAFGNNIFVDCPGAPPTGGFNNCYWRSGDVSASKGVDGNIEADPLFVDAAHDDYRLQPASPCRDAGLNAAVRPGETDAGGKPRLQGARVDIGAYEAPPTVTMATVADLLRACGGMRAATPSDAGWDADGVPGISLNDALLTLQRLR